MAKNKSSGASRKSGVKRGLRSWKKWWPAETASFEEARSLRRRLIKLWQKGGERDRKTRRIVRRCRRGHRCGSPECPVCERGRRRNDREWPGGGVNGKAGDGTVLSAEAGARRRQQEVEGEVRRAQRDQVASARLRLKYPDAAPAPPSDAASASGDSLSEPTLTQASRIVPKPVRWLWHKRIPLGAVSMITGHPNLGKSQIAAFLAATVTTAGELPCCEGRAPLGSVVVMVNEDDLERTVVPRLKAAGADLSKAYVLGGECGFDLNDLTGVEQHIRQRGDVRLLIVDAFDVNPTANVRKMLRPLQTVATKFNVAVVLVGHLTKNHAVSPLMQVRGPVGLVALARTVSLVAPNDGRLLFMQIKNNLAPTGPVLAYRSETRRVGDIEAAIVVWDPQPAAVTVEDLAKPASGPARPSKELEIAKDFLKGMLADGRQPAKELQQEAGEAGISLATLRRAANDLGVMREREGGIAANGKWFWQLPDEPVPTGLLSSKVLNA
jgi:AAA domain